MRTKSLLFACLACLPFVLASSIHPHPAWAAQKGERVLKKGKKSSSSSGGGDISDLILNGFNASPSESKDRKGSKSSKSKSSKTAKSCKSSKKKKKSSKCEEAPTVSPAPTTLPPTGFPTATPTAAPTESPTASPTQSPTVSPTQAPTQTPTVSPTLEITISPKPTTACSSKSKKCKSKKKSSKKSKSNKSSKSGKKRAGNFPVASPSVFTDTPTAIQRTGFRTHAPVILMPTPDETIILVDAVLPPEYIPTASPAFNASPSQAPFSKEILPEDETDVRERKKDGEEVTEEWLETEKSIEAQEHVKEGEKVEEDQKHKDGIEEYQETMPTELQDTSNYGSSETVAEPSPTGAPTNEPTLFSLSQEVHATPFTIHFEVSTEQVPTADDMEDAIWLTLDYLDDFFEFQFRDSGTEYKVLGGVHVVSQSETVIRFEVTPEFFLESVYIPETTELDELIQLAFLPPNLEILLMELGELPDSNPFSAVESLRTTRDDPSTPNVDESSPTTGILLGVSALLGVVVIAGISIYSRHCRKLPPSPKRSDASTVSDEMRILEEDGEESEIHFVYSDEDYDDDDNDSLFHSPFLYEQRKDDV